MLLVWPGPLPLAGAEKDGHGLRISLQRWEAAERLFRSDPSWLGGDGASSVDLGTRKILWLFGDSFIGTKGSPSRRDAGMVRNSIAIQTGRDPSRATMKFFWKTKDGTPASFFAEEGKEWFWPGSGTLNRGTLVIFLMRVHVSDSELGFSPAGWKAVSVPNPGKAPCSWILNDLSCPDTGDFLAGSSSVLVRQGFLYAYCTLWQDNSVYLARWPLKDVSRGDLMRPQWWMGTAWGWARVNPRNLKPVPVMNDAQVEFTVHYEPLLNGFLQVQTLSLLEPCLAVRTSPRMRGPWPGSRCIYAPPEKTPPGLLIYAGKAHRVFSGADIAFTYAVNAMDEDRVLDDLGIYYPRVLRGTITRRK